MRILALSLLFCVSLIAAPAAKKAAAKPVKKHHHHGVVTMAGKGVAKTAKAAKWVVW
jgi:hypothetical protein